MNRLLQFGREESPQMQPQIDPATFDEELENEPISFNAPIQGGSPTTFDHAPVIDPVIHDIRVQILPLNHLIPVVVNPVTFDNDLEMEPIAFNRPIEFAPMTAHRRDIISGTEPNVYHRALPFGVPQTFNIIPSEEVEAPGTTTTVQVPTTIINSSEEVWTPYY